MEEFPTFLSLFEAGSEFERPCTASSSITLSRQEWIWVRAIEIVVNLEVACYKIKARQNFEYKVFAYRFTNS